MTKLKTDKHHQRALSSLLGKSMAAMVLGATCLTAPFFFNPQSTLGSMAAGLRIPGMIALGMGLLLLGIRFSVQSRARKISALPGGTYTRKSKYGELEPLPYSPSGFPMVRTSGRAAGPARIARAARRR